MLQIGSHIARTNIAYFASIAILSMRGIALIPLLLSSLGVAGYGTYVLALSAVSYGVVIAQAGLDTALYQHLTPVLRTSRAAAVFWTVIQTAAAWAVALAVCGTVTAALIGGAAVYLIAIGCAGASMGQVLWGLGLAPLRCQERTAYYLAIVTAAALGDFLVTLGVAALTKNLIDVFAALALYHLVIAAVVLGFQVRQLTPRLWSPEEFGLLARFGLNGLLNQLVVTGYFVWDRTIISIVAGVAAVAAYAPGMALAAALQPLTGVSLFTLPTLLARSAVQRSVSMKRSILRQSIRQYALIAVPAACGLAIIAKPFLTLITSPSLAEIGSPIAWLGAGAMLASGLARFAMLALRAQGGDRWLSRTLLYHFFVFIALAAIPSYFWADDAPIIAAGAILIVNASQTIAVYRRLSRTVPHVLALSLFITPAAGTAGILILASLIDYNSRPGLIAFVPASIAIYAAIVMAFEHTGPVTLWRQLRAPLDLLEAPADEGKENRPAVILYSGSNHLFNSTGILYAAELAEDFKVHVIAHATTPNGISTAALDALRRRDIDIHWIPERRFLAKHEAYHEIASKLLEEARPAAVFLNDDMGEFNVVLARASKENRAPVICFQTGAFGASVRMNYDYAINTLGPAMARDRGLPPALGRIAMWLWLRARHYWHYYIAPVLTGYRPYPGTASIYLKRGHIGQRDGDAYLLYEPGARDIAIAAGTPAGSIVPVRHPLMRAAGRRIFDEFSARPEDGGSDGALVLVDLREDSLTALDAYTGKPDLLEILIEATIELANALSQSFSRVLIKPHPALFRFPNLLERISREIATYPKVTLVPPLVDAVSLLPTVRLVVGESSTVLKLAQYFEGIVVVSTTFADEPRKIFHASTAGIHLFPTWRDAVKVDLRRLAPADGADLAPEGATDEGIVAILRRRELL